MIFLERVSVIGSGLMGNSIALAIAWDSLPVVIYGLNDDEINNAMKNIKNDLDMLVASQIINEKNAKQIRDRITYSINIKDAVTNATFIIEAVPENLEIKQNLFNKLEKYCTKETIFASNSSSLTPSKMAENLQHPQRV